MTIARDSSSQTSESCLLKEDALINRLLPPELLTTIMILSIGQDWHEKRPFMEPLAFSRVCRYWRTVCLNTPQIWSSIYYGGLFPDGVRNDKVYGYPPLKWRSGTVELAALREQLRRSGTLPLDIVIGRYHDDNNAPAGVGRKLLEDDNFTYLWRIVFRELPRWRTVSLVLDDHLRCAAPKPFDSALKATILEEATIICSPGYGAGIDFRWLARAQALRRLHLLQTPSPSRIQLAWGGLTHLTLDLRSVEEETLCDCFEVLPRCVALEHLRIAVGTGGYPALESPVVLPSLRSLVLDRASSLCRCICAPKLEHLTCYMRPFWKPFALTQSLVELARRGPGLQGLKELVLLFQQDLASVRIQSAAALGALFVTLQILPEGPDDLPGELEEHALDELLELLPALECLDLTTDELDRVDLATMRVASSLRYLAVEGDLSEKSLADLQALFADGGLRNLTNLTLRQTNTSQGFSTGYEDLVAALGQRGVTVEMLSVEAGDCNGQRPVDDSLWSDEVQAPSCITT
ncbi:hypothetical protein EV715DRAFT_210298 [Schizophyllum commune]